jgi:hypothetical protein
MIETLVKPQTLVNDTATIKVIQLLGQLAPSDIRYVKNLLQAICDGLPEEERNDSTE